MDILAASRETLSKTTTSEENRADLLRERKRDNVCVCVCVCERERERERVRASVEPFLRTNPGYSRCKNQLLITYIQKS